MVSCMTNLSPALHPAVHAPHFWQGQLPVAFVFSAPGAHEKSAGRPVASATGENLSFALEHLHSELPGVFSSTDRYAYRITNAYSKPIAKSLGDASSQASDLQVQAPKNIVRVLRDISGCNFVILCGLKAQLLAESIGQPGRIVVCSWHTSNQALSSKFNPLEVSRLPEPYTRRQLRAKLWAQELLNSLRPSNHVA
jgi:hypothetical protein